MTENNICTQNENEPENCAEHMLPLYEAIRLRISESTFSRIKTDEEELLHVIFMKLEGEVLPPPDSEEMEALLNDEIINTIRAFKRDKHAMSDFDELDPDDGPSHDRRTENAEEEFEEAFQRFCDSCEEPERTVYRRCRTLVLEDIVRSTGTSHREITRILRRLPKKFQCFVKNYEN